MAGERDADEFKVDAVKLITDNGHTIADVAKDLGFCAFGKFSVGVKEFLYI